MQRNFGKRFLQFMTQLISKPRIRNDIYVSHELNSADLIIAQCPPPPIVSLGGGLTPRPGRMGGGCPEVGTLGRGVPGRGVPRPRRALGGGSWSVGGGCPGRGTLGRGVPGRGIQKMLGYYVVGAPSVFFFYFSLYPKFLALRAISFASVL